MCASKRDAYEAIATLMAPKGIAVLGASRRGGGPAESLVANLLPRYQDRIYLVNPHATNPTTGALRFYRSTEDLPSSVDVAAILVPSAQVMEALEQCALIGIRAAIVYTTVPIGDDLLRNSIKRLSEQSGMRILGPNCMGLFDINNGVNLVFVPVTTEAGSDRMGDTAVVGQSGGALLGLLMHGIHHGVAHSHFISTGNEADLTLEDFLGFLIDQTEVRVVNCYIEGIRRPAEFAEVAIRAHGAQRHVIAFKVGDSAASARAAFSHTGAIVGSSRSSAAFLDRLGVLRADGIAACAAAASVIRAPLPPVDGVGIFATSGGVSTALADLCARNDLEVPHFSPSTRTTLRQLVRASSLGERDLDNPLDLTAPGMADTEELWLEALSAVLADPIIGVVLAPFRTAQAMLAAKAAKLAGESGKPFVAYVYSDSGPASKGGSRETFKSLARARVPVYWDDQQAVHSVAALLRRARFMREKAVWPAVPTAHDQARSHARGLNSSEAMRWAAAHGVVFPRWVTVDSTQEVLTAARAMNYPLVVKVNDSRAVHKTEFGGVAPNLRNDAELRSALSRMSASLAASGIPDPEGFLVQEFVHHDGVEWLVGLVNDPDFGRAVAFGLGGALAELTRDIVLEPVPLNSRRAELMIARTRAGESVRAGVFRGRPIDRGALVDLLLRVSDLAIADGGRVIEFELNPVVTMPGRGAVALDVRALVREDEIHVIGESTVGAHSNGR